MNKFYITTAIPYVNDQPHLGHAMLHLYADVLARYYRQLGAEVIYSAGTDEHGGKIAEKAAEAGLSPKAYADKLSESFKQLLKDINITNDRFIRTTDSGHEQRAQLIWAKLKPHIYKDTYSGWYCTGCEAFYPEQAVKANNGICPLHNRQYEKLQEENYFFKLSQFTPKIKQAIESGEFAVIPKTRKNEILAVINSGLEDISISRPKEKIAWGIPVPGDPAQVMYVWFEALLNYITVLGYPEHQDFKNFWPADVQVIGKDILRFHAAIWPGILMGLGLPLPKTLYVHGFIEVDGKKMSKTLGNVVAPKDIVAKYGVDTFRYFFLRHIPSYDDGDFSWQRLEAVYNSELADQLGNAVSRTVAMINKYLRGAIADIPPPEHDIATFERMLLSCRFDKALEEIWAQIKGLNQYIEETKPWEVAKSKDEAHMQDILAYLAGSLLEISALLAPFMPDTADKIRSIFKSSTIKPLSAPLFPKTVQKPHSQPNTPTHG